MPLESPHSPEALQNPQGRFTELVRLLTVDLGNNPDALSKYAPQFLQLFQSIKRGSPEIPKDPIWVGNAMNTLMREEWGPNLIREIGNRNAPLIFGYQQFFSEHGKQAEDMFRDIVDALVKNDPSKKEVSSAEAYVEKNWTTAYGHDRALKTSLLTHFERYKKSTLAGVPLRDMIIPPADAKTAMTIITNEPRTGQRLFERVFGAGTDASKMQQDPAIRNFDKVLALSQSMKLSMPKDENGGTKDGRNDLLLLLTLTRNLHFKGITQPTAEDVRTEHARLLLLREEYKGIPLFKNRNVIYIAANERKNESGGKELVFTGEGEGTKAELKKLTDAGFSFGTQNIVDKITSQQGDSRTTFTLCRAERGREREEKVGMLELIAHSAPPLTLCLDGHGSISGDLSLAKNTSGASASISPKELAESLKKRALKFPEIRVDPSKRDIILSTACFGTNFILSLSKYMKESSKELPAAPMPICIAASEYNRPSYYNPGVGGIIMQCGILEHNNKVVTLGSVIDVKNGISSLPVIYLPDGDTRNARGIQQLAEKPGAPTSVDLPKKDHS